MTSGHILFIPGMILIGLFLGFILGARAARNQFDLRAKREAEREVVRAERAAKRAAKPPTSDQAKPPASDQAKPPASDHAAS